jgi:hypothetical protein
LLRSATVNADELSSGLFNIDDLHEPDWNDRPWDNLVLSADRGELLMAFGAYNKSYESSFDDFVKHKGKVSIIRQLKMSWN